MIPSSRRRPRFVDGQARLDDPRTTPLGGGGGLLGARKRVVGGGTLFMTEYGPWAAPGELAFATKLPGQLFPVEVGGRPRIHDSPPRRSLFHAKCPDLGVGIQAILGAGNFGGRVFCSYSV